MASRSPTRSFEALAAYEPLAAYYDCLTTGYAHRDWIATLHRVVAASGPSGTRLLDVACGTGKSSLPWLDHGYEVEACDISPAMVGRAAERLGPRGRTFVADMRELPAGRTYDLVTCLDDSVNYLLSEADLAQALTSMASVLRPGGALLFDCNSFSLYRERFVGSWQQDIDSHRFHWTGSADVKLEPGARFSARLEVQPPSSRGSAAVTVHHQRHHPPAAIAEALSAAGLRLRALYGQSAGARLSRPADEERHPKLLYFAECGPDAGGRPR